MDRIFLHPPAEMAQLMRIASQVWVSERAEFEDGQIVGTVPISAPYFKDYDSYPDDRLDHLPSLYRVENWCCLVASEAGELSGGLVMAARDSTFEPLQNRDDLGWVVDIRVADSDRRRGIGRALWSAAEKWAIAHGLSEIQVETQDINVQACRFYSAVGCQLHTLDPGAYPPEMNEVRVIWRKLLGDKS